LARGAVVIVEDDQVALIERNTLDRDPFFLFPGGQVEEGESIESASIREAYEELGVKVELGPLVAVVEFLNRKKKARTQYYYWAEIIEGQFGTGEGAELKSALESSKGTYTPLWIPLDELSKLDVRPKELAEALGAKQIGIGKPTLKIKE